MAVAWRHLEDRFSGFLSCLEPDANERVAASLVIAETTRLLYRRFSPSPRRASGPAAAVCLVGSHAKDTSIGGCNGVDLLLVLPQGYRCVNALGQLDSSQTWLRASADLASVLIARYGAVESTAHGWLKIVRKFAQAPAVSVCVRPAFTCGNHGYLIADNKARKCGTAPWRYINPEAELHGINDADRRSAGKARHLIRLLKVWRRTARVPITNLALELLACEFLSVWIYKRRSLFFYDWMIRDFFFWLAAQEARVIPLPGSHETLPTGTGWRGHALDAFERAKLAADLERDNRSAAALVQWRGLFGAAIMPAEVRQEPRRIRPSASLQAQAQASTAVTICR